MPIHFFTKVPVAQLISKKYATERRKLINPDKAAKVYDAGVIEAEIRFPYSC